MNAIICTVLILALIFLFYLWLIHPSTGKRESFREFTGKDYAHRGLWDLSEGIPENSMPAFRRAVEQGFAIELDVHLTKDHRLVVFHDDSLKRVCGVSGTPESKTLAELRRLSLSGTEEHMPTLQEVLGLVRGRTPILVEIKQPAVHSEICRYLEPVLSAYDGPYLIESFNPMALRSYRKLNPCPLFGLLSERYPASLKLNPLAKILSTTLMFNAICRPDFIAYNFRTDDVTSLMLMRKLFHVPLFAWTVRKPSEYKNCAARYDAVIFEKFIPS